MKPPRISPGIWLVLASLTGCNSVNVKLPTDDAFQFELGPVEVPIYQHGDSDGTERALRKRYKEVVISRRNRERQIRDLKADAVVGESREARLDVRKDLKGTPWDPKYVHDTVNAENADRDFIIKHEAIQRGQPEQEIRRTMWRQWQRRSFPGEWIEIEGENPGEFQWVRKQGASIGGNG